MTTSRTPRKRTCAELLHLSESSLKKREFGSCYKYAVKAQESDPDHPAVAQLIGISITLLKNSTPNRPDWYKILSLPSSNVEQSVIQKRFDVLKNLLDPSENPYPFANEALMCVLKAGSVLCDPIRRAYFDNSGETFWTKCPYCCYLFEYEKLFADTFLRCHNASCRRAYTAVPVEEKERPPQDVLEKGEYVCTGFYFEEGWGSTGVVSGHHSDQKANRGSQGEENNDVFIDISDIEDEAKDGGTFGSGDHKCKEVNIAVAKGSNNGGTERAVMKRRKVMARTTKKLMGRGVRVDMDEVLDMKQQKDEDLGMEQENNLAGVEYCGAACSSKENLDDVDMKLQFSEGDDDIFVGLDTVFWQ